MEINLGGACILPLRFSVAVETPRVPPLGSERVIVAVFVLSKLAAPFRGMEKEAVDCPALKLRVPQVAW
jgi:hypothetical protein